MDLLLFRDTPLGSGDVNIFLLLILTKDKKKQQLHNFNPVGCLPISMSTA